MKKTILFLFMAVFSTSFLMAQDISENALGIRLGDNDGFGGEISYQKKLSDVNRLEIDLGYRDHKSSNAFKLSGLYQWVWQIDGGLNWYAGFGAGVGSWSFSDTNTSTDEEGVFLNADGNVGVEYNFMSPFIISLDFRPEFGLIGDYAKGTGLDLALSVRYQF